MFKAALGITGFCELLVYPNGPLQAYAVPPVAVKLMFWFKHTNGLFTTIAGKVFTTTLVVIKSTQPFALLTVNV